MTTTYMAAAVLAGTLIGAAVGAVGRLLVDRYRGLS